MMIHYWLMHLAQRASLGREVLLLKHHQQLRNYSRKVTAMRKKPLLACQLTLDPVYMHAHSSILATKL
uniref:Uncharacterized protein n=1 Tax=Oryza rufipogon TaxID=4529 RepID=A0A0E0NFS7_ORYRU